MTEASGKKAAKETMTPPTPSPRLGALSRDAAHGAPSQRTGASSSDTPHGTRSNSGVSPTTAVDAGASQEHLEASEDVRRSRALLLVAVVFFWSAVYLYVPTLAPYAEHLGASMALVGLIVSAYGFSQLVLRIPVGLLSDRWGGVSHL